MSPMGVRRGKAAFSSGCEAHPANAPAGSNRSSHGGDEMAEAFGYRPSRKSITRMVEKIHVLTERKGTWQDTTELVGNPPIRRQQALDLRIGGIGRPLIQLRQVPVRDT